MTAFKRKIFYLSGFDPRGARFYHQLFAEQAEKFNAMAGRSVSVSKRNRLPPHSTTWTIDDTNPDTHTDYVFLGWDDVIRDHWDRNPFKLLAKSVRAYWNFLRLVDWSIFHRFPRGTKITIYYPGVSAILLPILCGLLLWLPAELVIPWPWDLISTAIISVIVAMVIVNKIQGFWLIRFIIFNDMLARRGLPRDVADRMDEFALMIADSLDQDWDEVLFVSHSNGSIMSIPVLARLCDPRGRNLPDNFSFISLGSCITLVSIRQDAHLFRADLDKVADTDFAWLDLGSITDGACIAGLDPCVTCPPDRRARLLQLSPRWFKYSDPATYKARRRNKHEVHFDYLRTFHKLSALDYIALSSGARPLSASIEAFKADTDV
jgi:hypothetical protein